MPLRAGAEQLRRQPVERHPPQRHVAHVVGVEALGAGRRRCRRRRRRRTCCLRERSATCRSRVAAAAPRCRTIPVVAATTVPSPRVATLGRRMAPLTVGHASVDFAQGAVPALLPYLARRARPVVPPGRRAGAGHDGLVEPGAAAVRRHLRPRRRPLDPAGRHPRLGARRGGDRVRARASGRSSPACSSRASASRRYHPAGARAARDVARDQPAAGMSIFSVGGNAGVAAGPVLAGDGGRRCSGCNGIMLVRRARVCSAPPT